MHKLIGPSVYLICVGFITGFVAVRAEWTGQTSALRGLVHAAILEFFALSLSYGKSPLPLPFATFGMILLCTVMRMHDAHTLSIASLAFAADALGNQQLSAASIFAMLGGILTLSVASGIQEAIAQVFHRAFVSALGVVENDVDTRNLFYGLHPRHEMCPREWRRGGLLRLRNPVVVVEHPSR